MMIKTDYLSHDGVYRRLRSEGKVGWSETEDAYVEQKSRIQEMLGNLCLPSGSEVLELGCGAGNITVWLAHFGYKVTGTDISPTAIDWARSRAVEEKADAEFYVADVLDLKEIEDNHFDLVVDGHCFHCIIGQDRIRFLSEAYRVLKPSGYFFIDTMCGPVKAGVFEKYDEHSRCIFYRDIAVRYMGLPDEIRDEVTSAGFRIIRHRVETGEPDNILIEATKDEMKGA